MRYVVIGAGAVGGTIGGRLYAAGRDTILVARGAHLDVLRERGLQLDEPDGSRTLPIPAVASPAQVDWRPGDIAVVATKVQDARAALATVPSDIPVVCAQNGVAGERFAAAGHARVIAMCVLLPAEHLEPGVVAAYAPGVLDVGRYPSGSDGLVEQVAADLAGAGFGSRADPSIMTAKYRKLLANLGNAVEATCGTDDPDHETLYRAAYDEGEHCLAAAGIVARSAEEDRARRGDAMRERAVNGRDRLGGSTWQSLRRGTGAVEAAYLNGEIVAIGQARSVPTPVNARLLAVADQMAARGEAPGSRRASDLLRRS